MAEEMRRNLMELMKSTDDVLGIIVTDRDGVPILKVAEEEAPELGLRPTFISTFNIATDQAGKLGMGRNNRMVCVYGRYQVVHFNHLPMVVTVIASSVANTGQLLALDSQMAPLLASLTNVVDV
ncbi:ragulator complex protein LAMTOR3-like [Portunus trituberculatus]|uniref:ragulator complex protein LAMTOR3-like n=1 Tax=Portunus trituberculatus TaxID=210409 RepID=UPI001E1D0344|nr:ragulator complex protein LAMTOR3-like [Portunus trituberculatus]